MLKRCEVCGRAFNAPPSGNKSCGDAECKAVINKRKGRSHGQSGTRLYNIWCGMKSRVKGTAGGLATKYYAEVSLCDEWKSFENFQAWALATGYREPLEIDRKDNTKGYSPDNCRWATRCQQMQNTRVRTQTNKTSKYRGVAYVSHCTRKWRAQGHRNGKPIHLGLFETESEAAAAYDAWASRTYGQFAVLNIKEEWPS